MPAWIYLFPIVAVNVLASLLLKTGAGMEKTPFLFNLFSWRSLAGLACFGVGGFAYAWVLRYVPLGVAQAILASQYVFTVLSAWLLLREQISSLQGIGFALIALGILLVLSK